MEVSRSMRIPAVLVILLVMFASIVAARGGRAARCGTKEQKKAFKTSAKAGSGEGTR